MAKGTSFRVGRVTAYLRGQVWYLRYHENGRRRQVRVSPKTGRVFKVESSSDIVGFLMAQETTHEAKTTTVFSGIQRSGGSSGIA